MSRFMQYILLGSFFLLVATTPSYAQEMPLDSNGMPLETVQSPEELAAERQKKKEAYDALVANKPKVFRSVMYFDEEVERLEIIMEALANNEVLPEENMPQLVTEESLPESSYVYPQFYLKSIMFRHDKDWVLWINDQKLTSDKPDAIEGLTIENVSHDSVVLTYSYKGDTKIQRVFDVEDTRIEVNAIEQAAKVLLHPNQTFSLYSWKIFEGYVVPVRYQIKGRPKISDKIQGGIQDVFGGEAEPVTPAESPEQQEQPAAPPPAAGPAGGGGKGLKALMDQYKQTEKGSANE